MTPQSFQNWLAEMRETRRAKSDKECAALLGVAQNSVVIMKREGTKDLRTDLACRALLHGMQPYT